MELKKFFGQHIEPFNGQQSIAMTQYTVNTSLHIHYTSSLLFTMLRNDKKCLIRFFPSNRNVYFDFTK